MMTLTRESKQQAFGDRLVRLLSGDLGLRASLPTEMEPEGESPVITFTASTASIDRYEETIDQSGWKLRNFERNPVFQRDHHYSILSTLGRSERTWVEGGSLRMRILFAVDIHREAHFAWRMYREGFLNAVSVGFIPIEWQNGGAEAEYRRKFLQQELIELSAVAIPANPDALQDAWEPDELREIRRILDDCLKRETASPRDSRSTELNRLSRFVRSVTR